MKKKSEKSPVVTKIEIDEKTAEPTIVELSEKEAISAINAANEGENSENTVITEAKKIVDKANSKTGKQLAMQKVFGLPDNDNITKRQKIFKYIMVGLFIVFVVGVLAWTAYNDFFASSNKEIASFGDLMVTFGENWYHFILALCALGACFLLKGLKLSIMCKAETGKWHFKTCLETGIVGFYYNSVTPLAVGGQPFEIIHLSKHGVKGGVASSLPIATFFLNQLAFVLMGTLSLILLSFNALGLGPEIINSVVTTELVKISAIIGLICCFIMPSLVVIFSFTPRIGAKLVHFVMFIGGKLKIIRKPKETTYKTVKNVMHNSKCMKQLATNPLVLISTFILSLGEQFAMSSIAYFVLKFFGFGWNSNVFLEWLQVIQICLVLYSAISFIPTPGNSGAADFSFYFLFSTGLTMAGFAFPAMLLWRVLSFYSFIIIGFVFTNVKKRQDLKAQKLSQNL